jgi:nitrate reductase delta subunit
MTENDRLQCKLLAVLLEYPDPLWSTALADLDGVADMVVDERRRIPLRKFLAYAGTTPLIRLQESYTSAFDLDPATDLHLTYHLVGDSEDRGKALAGLLWVYHREGYDAAVGELPDYLPLMLEFLSLCPEPEDASLLWSCLGTVAALAERLERNRHPYAELLGVAADILQSHQMGIPSDTISKEV